jgi:hypothetical protein
MGLLAAVALVGAAPAHAQTVEAVRKVTEFVDARREDITDAAGRLRPFVLSGQPHESTPIQGILNIASSFDGTANAVSLVGGLVSDLKGPENVTASLEVFRRAARRTVESANDQLDFINAYLHPIRTPAALTEAVAIKDAIIAIRDALQPFTKD